jgi:hypothetical protein
MKMDKSSIIHIIIWFIQAAITLWMRLRYGPNVPFGPSQGRYSIHALHIRNGSRLHVVVTIRIHGCAAGHPLIVNIRA